MGSHRYTYSIYNYQYMYTSFSMVVDSPEKATRYYFDVQGRQVDCYTVMAVNEGIFWVEPPSTTREGAGTISWWAVGK